MRNISKINDEKSISPHLRMHVQCIAESRDFHPF